MTYDGRVEAQITIPAGGATISATNSGGGPTNVTVGAGTYFIAALCTALQAALQATRAPSSGAWTVTASNSGTSATGKVTIGCTGTWSISWTSTTLRDVLGFTVNLTSVATNQTGANQSPMLWIPDRPLNLVSDTKRAPITTDARSTQSPLGPVVTLVGNKYYRHRNLSWGHVAISRVWEAEATTVNASWETFLANTQLGQGAISWFAPSSRLMIYDHRGYALGADKGVTGWQAVGVTDIDPRPSIPNFTGYWQCELPLLVSGG